MRELADALYDEQQAIEDRNEAEREANRLRAEGEALTRRLRTAEEAYADEIERLRELLDAGAITQETFGRASEEAYDRMLRSSREWSDGVRHAIRDNLDDATDAAKTFEQATTRALKASEDAFVEWAMTGKFSAKDLFNTIAEEALRAAYRMAVVAPLNNILGSIFGAIGGSIFGGASIATTSSGTPMIGDFPMSPGPTAFAHGGGVIGRDAFPARMVDPAEFDGASRYHRGGIVGGEMPIVARYGEGVFTPRTDAGVGPGPGREARGQCRGQRPQRRARRPGFRRCAARAGRRSHPRHHDRADRGRHGPPYRPRRGPRADARAPLRPHPAAGSLR